MKISFLYEDNEPLEMTFASSLTVEEVLLEFLSKTKSLLILDKNIISFLYQNFYLNDSYFLTKKINKFLKKKINFIRVIDIQKNVIGKGNQNMYLSRNKKNPEKFEISKEGPIFKVLDRGLNIFGKCPNMSCRAYNREVAVRISFADFDFQKNQWDLHCPCSNCHCLIKPEIFGFVGCKYSIEGVKYDEKNETVEKFKTVWKTAENDEIQCYDPKENGSLSYIKLIIYTKKL